MCRRTSRGRVTTSKPDTTAVPEVGGSSVVSMRSVVVLPAPFEPIRPKKVPASTLRSSRSTAVRASKRRVRAAVEIAAVIARGASFGTGRASTATLGHLDPSLRWCAMKIAGGADRLILHCRACTVLPARATFAQDSSRRAT
jgi:hypothetical protein